MASIDTQCEQSCHNLFAMDLTSHSIIVDSMGLLHLHSYSHYLVFCDILYTPHRRVTPLGLVIAHLCSLIVYRLPHRRFQCRFLSGPCTYFTIVTVLTGLKATRTKRHGRINTGLHCEGWGELVRDFPHFRCQSAICLCIALE